MTETNNPLLFELELLIDQALSRINGKEISSQLNETIKKISSRRSLYKNKINPTADEQESYAKAIAAHATLFSDRAFLLSLEGEDFRKIIEKIKITATKLSNLLKNKTVLFNTTPPLKPQNQPLHTPKKWSQIFTSKKGQNQLLIVFLMPKKDT